RSVMIYEGLVSVTKPARPKGGRPKGNGSLTTKEPSGQRPGKARRRPTGEPPAVTLQAGGLVELHDDDLVRQHRRFDLSAQSAQAQRDHRQTPIGGRGDVNPLRGEGHSDGELVGHGRARSSSCSTISTLPDSASGRSR